MISFKKEIIKRSFLNPLNNFSKEKQKIEIRFDPLLNHSAIFNPSLEDKIKIFFGAQDWELVKTISKETKEQCFMCPPKVREITPKYPPELIPEGRLLLGECTLFPNLFPIALRHAVIAVGEKHFRRLKDFSPSLISQGLNLGIRFLRLLTQKDNQAAYGVLCANYLPPAGASLIHPHFQVLASSKPFPFMFEILKASKDFFFQKKKNFWDLLIETEEKKKERFLGRIERVVFLASFAPLGANEILGIIPCERLEDISQNDIQALAKGLSIILKGYEEMGYGSFNFTFYLPPLKEKVLGFRPHLRLITRQNFYKNYRTDDYFLQRQLRQELILTPPEKLIKSLKKFW